MKNSAKQVKKDWRSTTSTVLLALGSMVVITVAAILLAILPAYIFPHPLGDKLEYIGVNTSGELPFDDAPYTREFIYATNASADEIVNSFTQASIVTRGGNSYFLMKTKSGKDATISVSPNEDVPGVHFRDNRTDKRNIVTIFDYDYDVLKESL